MAGMVEIMDFGADDVAPEFYVGPQNHFVCVPDIPLGLLQQITQFKDMRKALEESGDLTPILMMFDQLLDERSAHLFRERVADRTIGIVRITRILPYVMEKYGLRPTQPSMPSSDGSVDGTTGTSSEAGASLEESTSIVSASETLLT